MFYPIRSTMDKLPKHRDDIKRQRSFNKRKKEIIETVGTVADSIIVNPELWFKPEFKKLRKFAYTTSNQPHIYPPPSNITTATPGATIRNLTTQFAADIYQQIICDRSPIDCNHMLLFGRILSQHKNKRFILFFYGV